MLSGDFWKSVQRRQLVASPKLELGRLRDAHPARGGARPGPGYAGGVNQLGRGLILVGLLLAVVGVVLVVGGKLGLGRLPGDLLIERKNFSFGFPIATSIVISVVLTLLANLLLRRR